MNNDIIKENNKLKEEINRLLEYNKLLEKKYLKYKTKHISHDSYNQSIINFIKSHDIYSDFTEPFYDTKINYIDKLIIKNDLEYIRDIYNKYNYIELRKYNNEKTLIIGCGNVRLDNSNLDICSIQNDCDRIKENKYHSHDNCFTIDGSFVANPCIIGTFNDKSIFNTIPNNSFNYIIFEGGGVPSSNDKEIQRLLKNDELSYCIDNDKVYSYYYNGIYRII